MTLLVGLLRLMDSFLGAHQSDLRAQWYGTGREEVVSDLLANYKFKDYLPFLALQEKNPNHSWHLRALCRVDPGHGDWKFPNDLRNEASREDQSGRLRGLVQQATWRKTLSCGQKTRTA